MEIYVKRAALESAIERACQWWAGKDPINFEHFKKSMETERDRAKAGMHVRTEMWIPKVLYGAVARELGDAEKGPRYTWMTEPECVDAFKQVFLVALLKPGRGV